MRAGFSPGSCCVPKKGFVPINAILQKRFMISRIRSLLVALALLIILALPSGAQTCTVNWNDVHQRIDGFGASSAFSGRTWASYTANIFFSTSNDVVYFDKSGNTYTNNGLGLSLLRNQIQPGGVADASELSLMKLVQPMGVRIWSTPWSPQASFTSNNTTIGSWFAAADSKAYAAQLAGYVVSNQTVNGITIYAVSIQNEPDANVGYVSCHWTPQEIHDFATNLYNAFQASNVLTKVMLPEDESWQTNLYLATMSDSNAAADVGIIADHNYVADNLDGDQNPPAALPSYGKALWETEVATLSSGTATNFFDPSITNAMYWATRIHLFMTVAQANAWHYWYLITGTSPSDNEGLMGTGDIPSKRMFAVGQFSRFIRPNYYRIGATNDNAGIMISAYKDSVSPNFAIVAINTNASTDISETFLLTNFNASSVTPWMTTSNLSLESQAPVPVSGDSFTCTLPALSVVTFVGQAMPTLNITTSGNVVTVYWQNVPGWNLYQNSNLAVPGGWSVNTNSTASNGTNYLSLTPPTGNLFFRLSNP
jgi:glucuronoarabinoxylan endo-1,4-beta-xylanase